jgi:hypothetical protein
MLLCIILKFDFNCRLGSKLLPKQQDAANILGLPILVAVYRVRSFPIKCG